MKPLIYAYRGKTPRIHPSAFIAPNATIIGDVVIGPDAGIFYGCVLRGDVNTITIGARSNVQDNSVFHVDGDQPCTLGEDVTIGHMALIHGATVADGCLIGMKAALLSGSTIGAGCLVAAGAVVLEGQDIPPKSLAAGVPAKVRRELSDEQSGSFIPHAAHYVDVGRRHRQLGRAMDLEEVLTDT
ncbi:gamma carbonic anhydrase family protein [Corynebacterium mendelii]|uniref:Gamma carbonic anhydrase family protein n=1 Tax=Corynebacterium mendelii TaxID=2765362 RepID=A0A939IXF1_9CORY|nr:gamma carbonic anhydrase family protein [Corynebacterium mendelii]MBN9644405.1 gamma carbonic anhydrase family protein [Corynebacterium mendelii]